MLFDNESTLSEFDARSVAAASPLVPSPLVLGSSLNSITNSASTSPSSLSSTSSSSSSSSSVVRRRQEGERRRRNDLNEAINNLRELLSDSNSADVSDARKKRKLECTYAGQTVNLSSASTSVIVRLGVEKLAEFKKHALLSKQQHHQHHSYINNSNKRNQAEIQHHDNMNENYSTTSTAINSSVAIVVAPSSTSDDYAGIHSHLQTMYEQASRTLQPSHSFNTSIHPTSSIIVVSCSSKRGIVNAPESFCMLTGFHRSSLVGRTFYEKPLHGSLFLMPSVHHILQYARNINDSAQDGYHACSTSANVAAGMSPAPNLRVLAECGCNPQTASTSSSSSSEIMPVNKITAFPLSSFDEASPTVQRYHQAVSSPSSPVSLDAIMQSNPYHPMTFSVLSSIAPDAMRCVVPSTCAATSGKRWYGLGKHALWPYLLE